MEKDKRANIRRFARVDAWLMLLSGFVCIGAALMMLLARGDLLSQVVRRQFINCYVSIHGFLIAVALTIMGFAVSVKLGVSVVMLVAENRLRFLIYSIVLAIAGIFLFRTSHLSHAWYDWSLSQRAVVAATNFFTIAVLGGAYLLVCPLWRHKKFGYLQKAVILVTLLFWGYILASCFRMIPIPYLLVLE